MTDPISPISPTTPTSMVIDVEHLPEYIKTSQKNALDHALHNTMTVDLKAKEKKGDDFQWLLSKVLKAVGNTYSDQDDLDSATGKMANMMKSVMGLAAAEKGLASEISAAGNFYTLSAAFKAQPKMVGDANKEGADQGPALVQNLARGIKSIVSNWNPDVQNAQQRDSMGQSEYVSISSATTALNQQGQLSQSSMDKLAKQSSSLKQDESSVGSFMAKLAGSYVGNST